MENLEIITKRVDELLKTKERVIIVIDGMCAGGKSTLAAKLQSLYDATLFHMDDYYLQSYQRTKERYEEPGGNVDYERFKIEIVDNIYNTYIDYKKFDCNTMTLSNPICVNLNKLIIIEGDYALNPYFGKYYDLSIFVEVNYKNRINRLMKREKNNIGDFISKWLVYEQLYFDKLHIKDNVDIIFNND